MAKLHQRYPHLLPLSAIQELDTRLPDRVENIGVTVLGNYVARHAQIDFVGAGFPCQPMSPAGNGLGVRDDRFAPFFDLMWILTWCQREQEGRPFQYMLENVQPGHLNNEDMRSANTFLLAFLGDPFLLDAASVGAPTHRLWRYWTNIMANNQLQQLVPENYLVPNLCWFLESEYTTSPVLLAD